MPRRAAVYVRISKDREGGGLGVQRQQEDCEQLAARLGWDVVVVHNDNDLSAYSGKPRPGYRALLADLREGRADAVLVWHTDRLHRTISELDEFIKICQAHDVDVQTVRAGHLDLSTPTGRMNAGLAALVAQHEVEHAQERMKRAKAQAASEGRWRGGRRPLGYGEDGATVVPQEAAVLLRAAEDILAGASLNAAARRIVESGVLTSTGVPMTSRALKRLLLRPRNAGLIEVRGEIAGPAAWPAIIPEETWRGVVSILTAPGRQTNVGAVPRWLGSGIYRCGVEGCDGRMQGLTWGNAVRGRHKAYACRKKKHLVRGSAPVDEMVHGVIETRLALPDGLAMLAPKADPERMKAAQVQVQTMRAKLGELADAYATDMITLVQLTDATAQVRKRLEAAEADLAARGGAVAALVAAPDPRAAWRAAPLDRQRAIVDELLVVTILPARRGRPAGWTEGAPYFDPNSVRIEWRQ